MFARRGTIIASDLLLSTCGSNKIDNTTMVSRKNKAKKNQQARQSVPGISGQGGYYADTFVPAMRKIIADGTFAKLGSKGGALLGSAAGSALGPGGAGVGSSAGSKLGRYLGSGISRVLGFGDYKVRENSLFKNGMAIPPGETVPSFGVMGQATRVRHREYIMDIVVPASPTAFTNTQFQVNPGLSSTFPWLASLANNYQQYKFNGLVFEFKTLSSDITSGGALGSVIMASNYDVVNPAYASKIEMENSQYAVSAKPSCSQIHTMECAPNSTANNLYYVRNHTNTAVAGQDNRFYNLANFQLATAGLPGSAGTILGELWASYDVSLYKPIINSDFLGAFITSVSPSKTSVFGTSPTISGNGISATVNTLTFSQAGDYLVTFYPGGTGLNLGLAFSGTTTPVQVASDYAGGATEHISVSVKCRATQPNQTLIVDASAVTTITDMQTLVSTWDYNFV